MIDEPRMSMLCNIPGHENLRNEKEILKSKLADKEARIVHLEKLVNDKNGSLNEEK